MGAHGNHLKVEVRIQRTQQVKDFFVLLQGQGTARLPIFMTPFVTTLTADFSVSDAGLGKERPPLYPQQGDSFKELAMSAII